MEKTEVQEIFEQMIQHLQLRLEEKHGSLTVALLYNPPGRILPDVLDRAWISFNEIKLGIKQSSL